MIKRFYSTYKGYPKENLPTTGNHPVAATFGKAAQKLAKKYNIPLKKDEGIITGNWSHKPYENASENKFCHKLGKTTGFFISGKARKATREEFKKLEKIHPATEQEVRLAEKATFQQKQDYEKSKMQENNTLDKNKLNNEKQNSCDNDE